MASSTSPLLKYSSSRATTCTAEAIHHSASWAKDIGYCQRAPSVLSHAIQIQLDLQGPLPMPVHIMVHTPYCNLTGPTAFLYSLICSVF